MDTTYNYSEYSKIAKNKKLYTNSCKAVKIPNGDLFIVCDTDDDTSKGKEATKIITDNIISYLSEKEYDNKYEELQNSILNAFKVVESKEDLSTIKLSVSAILLYDDEFYVTKRGDNQLFLFSNGNLNSLSNLQESPMQLKMGDVLLSVSKGLTSTVDFETINTEFKSNESVAQKNKNILDRAIDANASTDVSIQTLEITNSKFLKTFFIDESDSENVVEDILEKTNEELLVSDVDIIKDEITETLTDKNETNMDNNEPLSHQEELEEEVVENLQETQSFEDNEVEVDEFDEFEEDEYEEKKSFPLKRILLFALPLLLIAAAIKYYPLLKNKSNNQVTLEDLETKSSDGDTTATINDATSVNGNTTDEISGTDQNSNTQVNNATTTANNTATTTNNSSVSKTEEYFIIGENDFNNNTYKTIYQYIKNTNTSLTMDDIIAVNPDYRSKRFGDKIYLK